MPPLRTQRTQLQQLIVTLYGLYGESTGSLRVSTLVAMLAALGIDQQAARSTISRLKSKGILLSQKTMAWRGTRCPATSWTSLSDTTSASRSVALLDSCTNIACSEWEV